MKKLWAAWVVLAVLFLSVLGGGTAFAGFTNWRVWASDGWQGPGVYIPQGQRVLVSPHGQWSNGSNTMVGAQGYTAAQSKGFMPYCKYQRTQNLPFGRLIAMTRVSSTNFKIWDAGGRTYIYGPGHLYFRINERDGECLNNNYGDIVVDLRAPFIK